MAKEYRLLEVKSSNGFLCGDTTSFTAKYEWRKTRKKYFLFGKTVTKTWVEEANFDVNDHQVVSWLDQMEAKVNVWRTMK